MTMAWSSLNFTVGSIDDAQLGLGAGDLAGWFNHAQSSSVIGIQCVIV